MAFQMATQMSRGVAKPNLMTGTTRAFSSSAKSPAVHPLRPSPLSVLSPKHRPARPLGARQQQTISAAAPTQQASGYEVKDDVKPLFEPIHVGRFPLEHRVVLAPLTRSRALGFVPQPIMQEYYLQRTTPGGLLISEATVVGPLGYGYPNVPGIHTREQVEAWKPIAGAVKEAGGVFFCQLWHTGRAAYPDFLPPGEQPVSSSPIAVTQNKVLNAKFEWVDYTTPRALDKAGIDRAVEEFRAGAAASLEAGFSGVEVHGANGYLIDQFLKDEVNHRTDEYGGSIENRCRFALEVLEAVTKEVGQDRVGIRLSPFGGYLNATDSDPHALYAYLIKEINERFPNLAYVHFIQFGSAYSAEGVADEKLSLEPFRKQYNGVFIANGGFDRPKAATAVKQGYADLVAFGQLFISNPDLVKRLAVDAQLTPANPNTFYAPGKEGYIDYPFMEEQQA